jgi:hypothetical protein
MGWTNDSVLLDPRFTPGPMLPWSIDARAAIEPQSSGTWGWRVVLTGRSLATTADGPRVGASEGPLPSGTLGRAINPVAQLSAMVELHAQL